jgi:ATP-dependent exoDNAse (exonuclease V) alpha subunit
VLTGPDDVLVLTATRAHAAHLNTAIRDTLRATGHLGTDQLHVDTVDGPRGYSSGDQVLVTRNDPSRGLLNGDRATVTTLHPDHGALTIQLRDGRDLTLPGPYLADGRLDHAYALTVHKAQGQTSQLTLVAAAPSMTRETAYTALSRGRLGNYLYLTPDPDTPTPADAVGAWIADTALAETAHAIHRTSAHQLATDLRSVAVPPMGAERSSLAGMAHPEAPSSPRGLSI